ncbi:hypothetical protein HAX54_037221 [Datura stramonium]|uniref:Uncharacterized protein n=1 Tax=Datura stramonium TaxID=4076 RepID=A0ABS8VJG7_DATST|nr:hypothetical protein [Datura stramonium]
MQELRQEEHNQKELLRNTGIGKDTQVERMSNKKETSESNSKKGTNKGQANRDISPDTTVKKEKVDGLIKEKSIPNSLHKQPLMLMWGDRVETEEEMDKEKDEIPQEIDSRKREDKRMKQTL